MMVAICYYYFYSIFFCVVPLKASIQRQRKKLLH